MSYLWTWLTNFTISNKKKSNSPKDQPQKCYIKLFIFKITSNDKFIKYIFQIIKTLLRVIYKESKY